MSDNLRSFGAVAVPTFCTAGFLGAVFTVASGIADAIGLSSGASLAAGGLGAAAAVGAASAVAVVSSAASYFGFGPYVWDRAAGWAGFFTGLAAAGALTYALSSGEPAKTSSAVEQPDSTAHVLTLTQDNTPAPAFRM